MRNNKKYLSLLFFFLLTFSLVNAQTGTIVGLVSDGELNEPMAFANVQIKDTSKGTSTDFEGKYTIEIEEGTYTLVFSFVGYTSVEITDVVVKAGQETDISVTLKAANVLDDVVVRATARQNTEAAILNVQKRSITLLDGLSSQSIKKIGASDIANAVKNVPGVSVQGGKYVYVRGLGDRYTKSILNGMDIPGLDPDRNTIQMDIFPTNIIDNVIVVKSAAAEYPADFTGGVVDIVTKDFPTKAEYTISIGGSYNPDMHFNDDFLEYDGSGTDFIGYDNDDRNRPVNRYQPIPSIASTTDVLTTLTDSFQKQLRGTSTTSNPDFNFGFTAGNQYEIGDDKLGYQVSLSYRNETRFYEDRIDDNWSKDLNDVNRTELDPTRRSLGNESINTILVNGLAGLTFKTDYSKFKLNFLHIQNGESTAALYRQTVFEGGGGSGAAASTRDALLYTQRSITNGLLSGKHSFSEDSKWGLEWKFSPTLTTVYDKDHRVTPLRFNDEGNLFISPNAIGSPVRIWRNLAEESWAGKVDIDKKYEFGGRAAKLKFGGAYTFKFRDFSIDDYTFAATGNGAVANNDPNTLLLTNNIWNPQTDSGTFLAFGDLFDPVNAYEGEQRITAAYISNEFNLSEKLKSVLGIRVEQFESFYTGQNQSREALIDELIIDEFDFFPSANLIYALNDNSNLRASYSRTTARPSFKEASIAQIYDPITDRTFIGNAFGNDFFDAIRPSYMNNFDLRYEFFGEGGQMFAISGFYKDFTDPIEIVFFPSATQQLSVANLGNAEVIGGEIEFRQGLGFLGLEKFRINANVSIIDSKLTMSDVEFDLRTAAIRGNETVDRERELQGQSPYLINAGIDYTNEDKGIQTGLFYNVQGKTLEVVGTGIIPDVFTQPFNSLNFTFNKRFGKDQSSAINVKVSNILGDERESFYESFGAQDQIFRFFDPGTSFSLGYSFRF